MSQFESDKSPDPLTDARLGMPLRAHCEPVLLAGQRACANSDSTGEGKDGKPIRELVVR